MIECLFYCGLYSVYLFNSIDKTRSIHAPLLQFRSSAKMKLQASATLAALVAIASAQLGDIPPCAMDCFTSAIGKSSCSILDAYCQCTTDAQQISTDALSCICNDSTCSAQERAGVFISTPSRQLAIDIDVFFHKCRCPRRHKRDL